MYLSIEFQEEYKRLDRLCKDYLSSTEGVSEYIRQMESTPWSGRRYVYTWEEDYKKLKHVRWVRNQLAHEVGTLNSDICTYEDLVWVQNFYNRIINGGDPFTVIRKAKEQETRRYKEQSQVKKATATEYPKSMPQKSGFWKMLISSIKEIFSWN